MEFDPTRAPALTFEKVAQRLKLTPRKFQILLARGGFPSAEATVGNVHVWTERTVSNWLTRQP